VYGVKLGVLLGFFALWQGTLTLKSMVNCHILRIYREEKIKMKEKERYIIWTPKLAINGNAMRY